MAEAEAAPEPAALRILIINPNTSTSMTEALKPVVESLGHASVQYSFFTAPAPGVPSINSPADAAQSAAHALPHLLPLLPHHDAFLVACYSQHPLVALLQRACADLSRAATLGPHGRGARKSVTGIFEASVLASLALLGNPGADTFGIVSTGKIWETALQDAVEDFLGAPASRRFVGVETTGLNATDLHDLPADQVRERMVQATRRLVGKGRQERGESSVVVAAAAAAAEATSVKAVCLGCAGMAGLDDAVREACVLELGEERASDVHIVDGVKAGVGILVGLARAAF